VREVDSYLLSTERPVVIARRHWAVLLSHWLQVMAVWIAFALVIGLTDNSFLALMGLCFFFLSVLWIGWEAAEWYVEQFAVTDKRVLLVSGLIWKRVAIMPLSKVTDMTYERSPTGRLLGYGSFIMESAGQDQALSRIDYVNHPDVLYTRMSAELFGRADPDGQAPAAVTTDTGSVTVTQRLPPP
jgi:membrane protein YdbS with pleckstrin-like domain